MQRYAVEARVFNNGKIVAKVRSAEDGETNRLENKEMCDVWVDVFDSKSEADEFCKQYLKA